MAAVMSERVVSDQGCDMGKLGGLRFEELAAGGGVEEQIFDGQGRANGQARLFDAQDASAGDADAGPGGIAWSPGLEVHAGDRGDGREGFSAEAEGGDGEEIVRAAELRGGVALEGKERVVPPHAMAVIDDADELASAGFHLNADAGGSRVD